MIPDFQKSTLFRAERRKFHAECREFQDERFFAYPVIYFQYRLKQCFSGVKTPCFQHGFLGFCLRFLSVVC